MKTISLFEVVPDPFMLMTSPVLSVFQVVYSFVFENVNSLLLDELNLLEFQTGDGSGAFFLSSVSVRTKHGRCFYQAVLQ